MGYDTVYWLTWEEETPTMEEVVQEFVRLDIDNVASELGVSAARYWNGILTGEEETRWYNHQLDLAQLSKNWPEVTFQLEGDGETSDDHWREYFRDGKVHEVEGKLVFPEFDPEELAEPFRLVG